MLSMQDFPVDFAAVTTLKWGEGKRKAKMSENEKSSEIDRVSQLFLHGIVDRLVFIVCGGGNVKESLDLSLLKENSSLHVCRLLPTIHSGVLSSTFSVHFTCI